MRPTLSLALPTWARDHEGAGDWAHLEHWTRAADDAGVDRLLCSDHVVFGEQLDDYARPEVGGVAGGRQPTGPDGEWLEPLTLISYLAACSSRVRFATHVLLAALRRPVVLAKAVATMDVLSRGRIDLGVGVGWQRAEYDAAGVSFAGRGAALDQTLEVCTALWRNRSTTYDGAGLSFTGIHMMPKPVQGGGVPIWVSGRPIPAVLKRLATYGTGWVVWGDLDEALGTGIAAARRAFAEAGHDPAELQVRAGVPVERGSDGAIDPAASLRIHAPALLAAGVTDLAVHVGARPESWTRLSEAVDVFGTVAEGRDARGV